MLRGSTDLQKKQIYILPDMNKKSKKIERNLDHIYKYVDSDSSQKILSNSSLKITNPNEFNDPFDCSIPLFDVGNIDVVKILKEGFSKRLNINKNDPRLNIILQQQKNDLLALEVDIAKQSTEMFQHWDELIGQLRVLSLTTKPDNILMWSHYAKNHTGVALKFKYKSSFGIAEEVKYDEGERLLPRFIEHMIRVIVQSTSSGEGDELGLTDLASERTLNILLKYFYLKRSEWKYESEYRLVLNAQSDKISKIQGTNIDVIKFNVGDLEEVIFGISAKKEDIENISAIVQEKYPNATIKKAQKIGWELKI